MPIRVVKPQKEVDFYPQLFVWKFDEEEMPKKPCPFGMNCKNIKTKTCGCVHHCDGLKRGEYVLVSDKQSRYRGIKKTPCPSDTLTAVPVKKTAVTDMKEQFLQNMDDMGFYKVPIEQISSATLTTVPVKARSVKKTPCPSDTLTAVPDMKTQFLMLCSNL